MVKNYRVTITVDEKTVIVYMKIKMKSSYNHHLI